MSNKREREKRKDARLQEESKVDAQDRRTRILQIAAGTAFLVLAAVVVLIVVNSSGSSGGDAGNVKEATSVDSLLSGIPQEGLTLGDPKAPVELIEYGDLQCLICKEYSEEFLPSIIEGQVKRGEAKITFKNFVIISKESIPAGAAALAAGSQGRGWNYIELFYRNQGAERSGYVTDEFMTSIASGAGVANISKWNQERKGTKLVGEVEATTNEAAKLGFNGTPSFAIKGPGTSGVETIGTPESVGEFEEAISNAS